MTKADEDALRRMIARGDAARDTAASVNITFMSISVYDWDEVIKPHLQARLTQAQPAPEQKVAVASICERCGCTNPSALDVELCGEAQCPFHTAAPEPGVDATKAAQEFLSLRKREVNGCTYFSTDLIELAELLTTFARQGQRMAEWHSIETAPKDGTPVLVCRDDIKYGDIMVAYWDDEHKDPFKWWLPEGDVRLHKDRFTHWQSLPEPAPTPSDRPENSQPNPSNIDHSYVHGLARNIVDQGIARPRVTGAEYVIAHAYLNLAERIGPDGDLVNSTQTFPNPIASTNGQDNAGVASENSQVSPAGRPTLHCRSTDPATIFYSHNRRSPPSAAREEVARLICQHDANQPPKTDFEALWEKCDFEYRATADAILSRFTLVPKDKGVSDG